MLFSSGQYVELAKAHVNGASIRWLSVTFGLSVAEVNKALSQIFIPRNSRDYQSTSEMAKMQGLERDELFDRLHKDGMLEKYKDQKHFLTVKGFELGGRFATDGKVSDGYWSVWPESILGTQKNSAVELKKVIIDVIQWIKSGCNSNYVEKWAHVISENQDDGYLSTSKMIAKDDSNSSVVLQILEFNGYLQKIDGNWTPTPKAVVAEAKLRLMKEGRWYPVWKPSSTVIKDCMKKAKKLKKSLEKKFEYDSERKLFFIDTYIPLSSAYEQDRFSKMLLDLKKLRISSVDFFMKKLSCLDGLDFCVCAVPGHDPKKFTGVQELVGEMADKMPCRNISQYLRRKRKVARQHFLSKLEKRSPSEEAKTLKLTNKDKFKGKRVLLIDDITTSGGTIKGAKKFILANTDAKEVSVLVLGKTML